MSRADLNSQLDELIAAADKLPLGDAMIDLLQEAVRLADSYRDVAAGYRARLRLLESVRSSLRYDLFVTTFAWCLAIAEADPAGGLVELLMSYEEMLEKVPNFPHITRDQFEAMFAHLTQLCLTHGRSLRGAYQSRRAAATDFGDPVMAAEADREFRKHPRPERWEWTWEWELLRQVEYETFRADDEAAARLTLRYFARRDRDREWWDPCVAGQGLLPLFRTGRVDEAAQLHRRSYRHFDAGRGYGWQWAKHLTYLTWVDRSDRGIRMFEAQLPVALAQPDPLSHFHCLFHAKVLFDRLVADGIQIVTMRAPGSVPWGSGRGKYEVGTILRWIRETTSEIAAQFDRRNGNRYYSDLLNQQSNN